MIKKYLFCIFLILSILFGVNYKFLYSKELTTSNLSNSYFEKILYDSGRLLSINISENKKIEIHKRYNNLFSNGKETLIILMYHGFYKEGETTKKIYSISKKDFEEELEVLKELSFEPVSIIDVYYYVKFGMKIPERSVLLTFDDGFKNFMLVYPVLKKYGYKGVISLITGYVGSSWELDIEQIKLLYDEGLIDFASHSHRIHNDFKKIVNDKKYNEIDLDIKASRDFFNSMNIKTFTFTYPLSYGSFDENLHKILLKYGFKMALGAWNEKYVKPNSNVYQVSRIEVSKRNGLNSKEKFKDFLLNYLKKN